MNVKKYSVYFDSNLAPVKHAYLTNDAGFISSH